MRLPEKVVNGFDSHVLPLYEDKRKKKNDKRKGGFLSESRKTG